MVRLVIVGHPVERMLERGISEKDVYRALHSYVTRIEGRGDSITYIGPSESGSLIKVFLLKPGLINGVNEVIVKSVAWHCDPGGAS